MRYTPVRSYTAVCKRCGTKVSVGSSRISWDKCTLVSCPVCKNLVRFTSDLGFLLEDVSVKYSAETSEKEQKARVRK